MAAQVEDIGARLRAGREKLQLTVLQAAERVHVDPKILEALEANQFESLGAPVYARGHLRRYADFVGESVTELNELYLRTIEEGQPDLTRIAKVSSGHSGKLLVLAVVVVAVFGVVGAVWWISTMPSGAKHTAQPQEIGTAPPPPLAESSPPRVAAPQAASGTATSANGSAAAASNSATPAKDAQAGDAAGHSSGRSSSSGLTTAAPKDAGADGAGTGPVAPGDTSVAAAGGSTSDRVTRASRSPAGATAAAKAAVAGGPAPGAASSGGAPSVADRSPRQEKVILRFASDSWTEVYDATGARLFFDVAAANSVQTLKGQPPLRIVLGNAAGVALEVNGHGTPIPKPTQADGGAQFYINRAGHAVHARPPSTGG